MTGDLKNDLILSLTFEAAKRTLTSAKTVRDLVDAWWVLCDMYEGGPRAELMAIYNAKLKELGVVAAA